MQGLAGPRLLLVSSLLLGSAAGASAPPAESAGAGELGSAATVQTPVRAATAGYVPDAVCAQCHRALWDSYQEVGMAKAFRRPRPEEAIEDFQDSHFYHAASDRHYRMSWRHGRLWLRRWQVDAEGRELSVLEEEVDWILGSGHSSRSYLYQTELGELFQLPLVWYSQPGRWGMAPGYDHAEHKGFQRAVSPDCMFCHNAFPPGVGEGADRPWSPRVYPPDLPQGLGCQRCHGPGEDHVRLALDPQTPPGLLSATVVNPGRLAPPRRDDVCFQCHLQPTVTSSGVRRFGRGAYSFRPGQDLAAFLVHVEVVEGGPQRRDEQFEINHHGYRLLQSRCFQVSGGALSCLTCHDPHRKVPAAARADHYRRACLSCHGEQECQGQAPPHPGATAMPGSCVDCHMPRRRTQDVVQAVMTDHLIRRRHPSQEERLGPRPEQDRHILRFRVLFPDRVGLPRERELYELLARVRGGSNAAVPKLAAALARSRLTDVEPFLDLVVGQLRIGDFAGAEKTLAALPEEPAARPLVDLHTAVALSGQGRGSEALPYFRAALEANPRWPEAHFNLAAALEGLGRGAEAIPHYQEAVRLRPNLGAGWRRLADALVRAGSWREAAEPYRRAAEIEPRDLLARTGLVRVLSHLAGEPEAAPEQTGSR